MSKLPFKIPVELSDKVSKYDRGYLQSVLPHLESREPITKLDDIRAIYSEMGNIHSSAMLYHEHEGVWCVSNYSYENITFLPWRQALGGDCYHVTGFDGTRSDGEATTFLQIRPGRKIHCIPQMIGSDGLKGLVVARKPKGMTYWLVELVIGNRYDPLDVKPMPKFRGEGDKGSLLVLGLNRPRRRLG